MNLLLVLLTRVLAGPYGDDSELPETYCFDITAPCHNFCERFAKDDERLQGYVRQWHQREWVPYNLELTPDSFKITTALLLAQKNCLNQGLKIINKNIFK